MTISDRAETVRPPTECQKLPQDGPVNRLMCVRRWFSSALMPGSCNDSWAGETLTGCPDPMPPLLSGAMSSVL